MNEWLAVVAALLIYVASIGWHLGELALSKTRSVRELEHLLDMVSTTSWLVLTMLLALFVPSLLMSYASSWSPWYGPHAYSGLSYRRRS